MSRRKILLHDFTPYQHGYGAHLEFYQVNIIFQMYTYYDVVY